MVPRAPAFAMKLLGTTMGCEEEQCVQEGSNGGKNRKHAQNWPLATILRGW